MKRVLTVNLISVIILTIFIGSTYAQNLSAIDILKNVDKVMNSAKDSSVTMKVILIDKDKNEKVREMETLEKAENKRLIRFISPADQKGISFLSLPDDVQYVYLPAFRKVRRVASNIKNTNFAGMDFTYEDLSTFEYAKDYDPKLIETTDSAYVLELIPKQGVKKDYSKLKMWVRKDIFYPIKTESYDKKGSLFKILERRRIEKVGNYWVAKEMEMKDVKSNHSTKIIITKIEVDVGLSDDLFTQRNMSHSG